MCFFKLLQETLDTNLPNERRKIEIRRREILLTLLHHCGFPLASQSLTPVLGIELIFSNTLFNNNPALLFLGIEFIFSYTQFIVIPHSCIWGLTFFSLILYSIIIPHCCNQGLNLYFLMLCSIVIPHSCNQGFFLIHLNYYFNRHVCPSICSYVRSSQIFFLLKSPQNHPLTPGVDPRG